MFRVCTDDEKPPPVPPSVNTAFTGTPAKTAPHTLFLDKLQELNTSKYVT